MLGKQRRGHVETAGRSDGNPEFLLAAHRKMLESEWVRLACAIAEITSHRLCEMPEAIYYRTEFNYRCHEAIEVIIEDGTASVLMVDSLADLRTALSAL